jgi:hypothetical protein
VKKLLVILVLVIAAMSVVQTVEAKKRIVGRADKMQYRGRDVSHYDFVVEANGDTTTVVYVNRVFCFAKPMDMSKHWRLVRDFRAVYPLAQVAKSTMAGFEEKLLALPSRKQQRQFSRATEKALVSQYTPTMKRMTVSQGKILVRLIDRETEMTSYDIIREFRGGFVAGFWQGMARLFGHNLKDEYDAAERDRMIEQCILMHEAGLLPVY